MLNQQLGQSPIPKYRSLFKRLLEQAETTAAFEQKKQKWVDFGGIAFPSVEHAYQAAKTTETSERYRFTCCTAGQAKRMGQQLTLRPGWEELKFAIMMQLVLSKFSWNPALRSQLQLTGERNLVELNHWRDEYWGVEYTTNTGQNQLGKILMAVRAQLATK